MCVSSCNDGCLSLLRQAILIAMAGWSTLSFAQAADLSSRPPPPNNPFDWLCRGLPLDNVWRAPGGGAVDASEAKRCAATLYLGEENDTGQANMFGLKRFVPPYAYKFSDSSFVGGSLSRIIGELGQFVTY